MNRIKVGDEVVLIAGKDKGRKGKITKVLDDHRILVQGVNLVKKHRKGNPNTGDQGGILEIEAPIQKSNVMLYDATTGKPGKVGFRTLEDGKKVRYFRSSGEVIDS